MLVCIYRNEPKFSDRQIWADSADSTLFAILFSSFGHITQLKGRLVQIFRMSEFLGFLK